MLPVPVRHSTCGGVTDGSWTLSVYYKASLGPFSLLKNEVSGRNLHSLLDSAAKGRPCPAPPAVLLMSRPVVVRQRCNTYHCEGLLPWGGRKASVTCPSMLSPTKWVRRRLTNRELLQVLDIPESISSILPASALTLLISDTSHLPMKVVLQLLNWLPLAVVSTPTNNYLHETSTRGITHF